MYVMFLSWGKPFLRFSLWIILSKGQLYSNLQLQLSQNNAIARTVRLIILCYIKTRDIRIQYDCIFNTGYAMKITQIEPHSQRNRPCISLLVGIQNPVGGCNLLDFKLTV